jgi:SAM-dependent methyltransferase
MKNATSDDLRQRHLRISAPSPWVRRFAQLVPDGGTVLDIASGGGRHARWFLERGHAVTAIDRNQEPLEALGDIQGATVLQGDLEDGSPIFSSGGPLADKQFDGIVVVNYLHRPLFSDLLRALAPGGVLIYETFALGNEEFARPRNPNHLLKSGELLGLVQDKLQVIAYEHGVTQQAEIPGVKQRLVAVNNLSTSRREDGDPAPMPIDRVD